MERIKIHYKDYLLFIVIVILFYCDFIEGADESEEKPRMIKERRRHDNQFNNDDGFDENFIALAPDENDIFNFDEMFNSQLILDNANPNGGADDDSTGGGSERSKNTIKSNNTSGKISYHIIYNDDEDDKKNDKILSTTRKSVILNENTRDYDVMMDENVDYAESNQKLKTSYNTINQIGYQGENEENFAAAATTSQPKTTSTTTTTTSPSSYRYNLYLAQLHQQEKPQHKKHVKPKQNNNKNHKKHHHHHIQNIKSRTNSPKKSKYSSNNNNFDYHRQGFINFYDNNNFYDAYQSNYHMTNHNSDKWPHLTKVTKNLNKEEKFDEYLPPYVKKFNRRNKQLSDLLDGTAAPSGHHKGHKHNQHHHHHHHHHHHQHRDDWIENLFEEQKPGNRKNHTLSDKTTIHPNDLPDDGVHIIYDKSHYENEKRKVKATNKYDQNLQTNDNNYFNSKTSNFVYHRVEQPPQPASAGTFGRVKKQRLPYVAITDRKLGPPRTPHRSSSSSDNNHNNRNRK